MTTNWRLTRQLSLIIGFVNDSGAMLQFLGKASRNRTVAGLFSGILKKYDQVEAMKGEIQDEDWDAIENVKAGFKERLNSSTKEISELIVSFRDESEKSSSSSPTQAVPSTSAVNGLKEKIKDLSKDVLSVLEIIDPSLVSPP